MRLDWHFMGASTCARLVMLPCECPGAAALLVSGLRQWLLWRCFCAAWLRFACRSFNKDKDGWLSFEEFNAALVRMNFVGVQREVQALFDRYDTDGSGFLAFEEFSAALFGLIPNPAGDPVTRSAMERVRAKIAERGGLNGIRSLGRIMRIMDDNGNGKLNRDELKYGLRDFGVDLSDKDLDTVIKTFDRNGDGQVDYDELLIGLRGNMSRVRREVTMQAFEKLDRDGSGEVTIEDLREVYHVSDDHPDVAAGRSSKDEALVQLLDNFDSPAKDGIVTREEFLDAYKGISASIDDDDYYLLMMRNAWHIMEGEGATRNTSNLRVLVTRSDGSQQVVGIVDDFGLDKRDYHAIKAALEEQGETDIADIQLAGS